MINNVELFINDPYNAKLDLMSEVKVALQYSLADIRDISKRNAAYSKTILLPGTKNNNYWLGNLFDINADFSAFNPNKKTAARLLVNTETVIDGFLQLRKIKKLNNTDDEGNYIQYEVVVFNNAVDLMSELGEKKLNELDLAIYNHTYNRTNIVDSWTHTWQDGYVYPLYTLDNTLQIYELTGTNTNKLYPAIFYKTVLDQMIREAGFGWTGSLATNAQFEKEIIPFTGEGLPIVSEAEQLRRQFRANTLNAANVITANPYPSVDYPNIYMDANDDLRYRFNYDVPPLDPNNHWNSSLYEWTVDSPGTYHLEYNLSFRVDLKNDNTGLSVQTFPPSSLSTPRLKVSIAIMLLTPGGSSWVTLYTQSLADQFLPSTLTPSQVTSVNCAVSFTTGQYFLLAGSKVKMVIVLEKPNSERYSFSASTGYAPKTLETTIVFFNTSFIKNYAYRNQLVAGDLITWEQFLSDKIKQKDLLTDLIKRYNLFIRVDADNPRMLILDTRTDFYDTSKFLDWTEKKDYSREDEIELLSELQVKEMLFTFKPDTGDLYNSDYTAKTGDIFGQFRYTFDNDFVKGEKKIESPFSPTPIDKNSLFGAIAPALNPSSPKGNPRILYYGGLRNCGNWFFDLTVRNQYPYAGYYDDPINPTLNIMFGNPKYEYYTDRQSITTNNMYNLYWADYVRQIEDGKLLTAFFYLNEKDISYIKDNFDAKIFIKDSYYYVNKIVDYNPLENEVTKVELLKIKDGVKWIAQDQDGISPGESCPTDIRLIKRGTRWYYVSDTQSVTQDCCTFLKGNWDAETQTCAYNFSIDPDPIDIGDEIRFPYDVNENFNTNGNIGVSPGDLVSGYDNIVGGSYLYFTQSGATQGIVVKNPQIVAGNNNIMTKSGAVIGDNNTVAADKSFIVGDNNTVNSLAYLINASDNVITTGDPVLIGTKGLTVSEGNKVYLGNQFNIQTETGDITWKGATLSLPTEDELTKTVKIDLEPNTLYNLLNSPVTLIPAPAVDTNYIDILSARMLINFDTTVYEGDQTLTIWYESADTYKMIGQNFLGATVSGLYDFRFETPSDPFTIQTVQGRSVYLTSLTDLSVNGDSSISIIVNYRIVDI